MRFRFPVPFRTRGAASLLDAPVPTQPPPRLRSSTVALYALVTVAIAIGVGFYMGRSTENYIAGVYENHWSALTTRPAAELSAWGSQRRAQGELLAHVARVARDTHPVNAVLLSMVGTHGCVGAWLVTASGVERAGVGEPGTTPTSVIASHGAHWKQEVASDTGGVRTVIAPRATYLDIVAPVGRTTLPAEREAVLLRFDLARADLTPLLPSDSAAPTPTLAKLRHTLLLAHDGNAVRILRVAGGASPVLVQRTLPFAALPPDVREALRGQWAFGRGPGVLDRDVMFSVRNVPGLDWAVLREASYHAVVDAASGGSIGFNRIMGAVLVLGVFGVIALAFVVLRLRNAHALSRMRSDFIAGISHEVRTPLAQVRMFAELLHSRRITAPEDIERSLRIIETEAQRLSVMLDDILDYSAREHARPVVAGAVDAAAHMRIVVRETVEAFAPLAAERGVRVVDAVEGDVAAAINPAALRHVLTNLVANATKYGPASGTVTVRAGCANGRVTICVDDEGAGVPAEERERIWLPFERGRRIPTAHAAGYGIGLAVARELVTRFGGTTRVEDAPGGGARFVVELPAAVSAEAAARDPLVGAA